MEKKVFGVYTRQRLYVLSSVKVLVNDKFYQTFYRISPLSFSAIKERLKSYVIFMFPDNSISAHVT